MNSALSLSVSIEGIIKSYFNDCGRPSDDIIEAAKNAKKEIKRLEGMLFGINKKLSNENFVSKAPEDVIEKEKSKKNDWEKSLEKLKVILEDLK